MRRMRTPVVVAAVCALGLAAVFDAVRGDERAVRSSKPTPKPSPAVAELRSAGVRGVLTYADENCRLHALALPDLEPRPAPDRRSCEAAVRGELVFVRRIADPQRFLVAICRDGEIEVRRLNGPVLAHFSGCAPAWKPDGTLTGVRGGNVVALISSRVLLPRRELVRAFTREGWARLDYSVEELAWLDETTLAVIVRAGSHWRSPDLLALFRGRRLVGPPVLREDLAKLRVSPEARYVTASARVRGVSSLVVIDRRGRRIPVPARTSAVAWSPDERWMAEATAEAVYLFSVGEQKPRLVRLPIIARDLVWR